MNILKKITFKDVFSPNMNKKKSENDDLKDQCESEEIEIFSQSS